MLPGQDLIVDGHTHAWPDAVAKRALGDAATDLPRFGDGTVASLSERMDEAGIDRAVCLAVAPAGRYVEAANEFVGGLDRERFFGFGSIHPELSAAENLASLRRNRLAGVKVHPVFQRYRLDDPRLDPIWEALEGEFVVTVHVGKVGGGEEAEPACSPAMVRSIVERFPGLALIACHFGGYHVLREAEDTLVGQPLHLDTSWPPGVAELGAEELRSIVARHGAERIVFGSDWPMASPLEERRTIEALGLSSAETAAILGGNLTALIRRHSGD